MPRPRRIRVMGVAGAGKSRSARDIASVTGLPMLELDAVFWGADWTMRDIEEGRGLVREFLASHPEGWVIDGNWTSRLEGLLDPGSPEGPDVVAWLDPPRRTVMRRVVSRTLRRGILREELWHGNRERPSTWLRSDPAENIMRWAWTQHGPMRDRMTERIAAGWPVVRLATQRDLLSFLRTL